MTDIVDRLRAFDSWEKLIKRHKLVQDAADEIERLREALRRIAVVPDDAAAWDPVEIAREALGDD